MKKRDLSLDVIRIIAIFMIVVFHFAGTWGVTNGIFLFYANGTWGSLGTALFFILSGYLLRKRYKSIESVKAFYIKRWLSIYPPFYIAFLAAYLINVIRLKSFFYQGPAYSLIYSVLGIDNYLNWFDVSTYALVGEWFTAVIVVLYLVFPLLNRGMNGFKWTITVLITLFYIIYITYGLYPKLAEISFVSCGFVFWIGMLLAEHEERLRKHYYKGVIAILPAAVFLFCKINIPEMFSVHILAILLFVIMVVLLQGIKGEGKFASVIAYLSKISYAVYIVHHYIVNGLASISGRFPLFEKMPGYCVFAVYLIIVLICAAILEFITGKLVKIRK